MWWKKKESQREIELYNEVKMLRLFLTYKCRCGFAACLLSAPDNSDVECYVDAMNKMIDDEIERSKREVGF